MSKIQAIRGMNDILPEDAPYWQYLESLVRDIVSRYGYQEIRTPVVEQTHLFKRSIGEVTDIVEKEMYTFDDRNGESITMRPEGTASTVRAGIEHGLLYNQVQKLYYFGPMFRYERPQKGRYRQFHQIGIETFGIATPDIDAELMLMSYRIWQKIGIADSVTLELNTLGSNENRQAYKVALVEYLQGHFDDLDEDSQRRLESNPLRILDSKSPQTQAVLDGAPKLHDFLDEDSIAHFESIKQTLEVHNIPYVVNPKLVRGLDYYTKTVFEWTTNLLGAQGTVCAGGRFDGLVEQLGGKATPACGFAMGVERLILLLKELNALEASAFNLADVYIVAAGEGTALFASTIAEQIRSQLPQLRVVQHLGGGNFKKQMKKADASGANFALLIGENELNDGKITLRYLRDAEKEQETLELSELISRLAS